MFPALNIAGGVPEETIDLSPDLLVFNIEGRKDELGAPGLSPGLTLCVTGARTGTRVLLDTPQQTLEWHAAIVRERDRKYVHLPDATFSEKVRAEFWQAFTTSSGQLLRELYFACDSDRHAPSAAILMPVLQSLHGTFKQLMGAAAAECVWGSAALATGPLDAAAAKAFVEVLAVAASEPCVRALLLALRVNSSAMPAFLQDLRQGSTPQAPPAPAAPSHATAKKTAKVTPAAPLPAPLGFPKSPAEAVSAFVRWLRSLVWSPKWVQPPRTFVLTLLGDHPAATNAASRVWSQEEGEWLQRAQFRKFPQLSFSHLASLTAPGPWLGAFALLCADAGDTARLLEALNASPEALLRQALAMSTADAPSVQSSRSKHGLGELLFHRYIMTQAGQAVRERVTALICTPGTLSDDSLAAYVRFALQCGAQDALLSLLKRVFFAADGSLKADVLGRMGSPATRIVEELAAFLRPASGAKGPLPDSAASARPGEWSRGLLEIVMRLEASSAHDAPTQVLHLESLAQALIAEPPADITATPQARLDTLRGRVAFLLFLTEFTSKFASVCAPNAAFFPPSAASGAASGRGGGDASTKTPLRRPQSLLSQWGGDAVLSPTAGISNGSDDSCNSGGSNVSARQPQTGSLGASQRKGDDWRRDWVSLVGAPPAAGSDAGGAACAAASARGVSDMGLAAGSPSEMSEAPLGTAEDCKVQQPAERGASSDDGLALAPGMHAGNPHARLRNAILDAVFGLLSLTLATDAAVTVFFLERPGLEAFFTTYLRPGGPLRERLIHLLQVSVCACTRVCVFVDI